MIKKILIVDDSLTIRQLLRYTLELNGYEVVEAANGQECLELMGKKNDVVMAIIDVNMPTMNGIELTRRLKKSVNPNLPIVVLTTDDHAESIDKARAEGACAYMIKPFTPEQLEAVVRKIAGES